MQKTILKYVKGLSADANAWERRNHKKYGNIANVCRQIQYDMKHGVTEEEVMASFSKIRVHSSFQALRRETGSLNRLTEIEEQFTKPKEIVARW